MNLIRSKMAIVSKMSKAIDLDYHMLRERFKNFVPQIINNLEFMSAEDIISAYNFIIMVNMQNKETVELIEKKLLPKLLYQFPSNLTPTKNARNLLAAWMNQTRHSQ